jgi:hypothetical protein
VEGLLKSLEGLTKIAAILAVAGYLSLRAHFNHIGISSLAALSLDRYLLETFTFVVGSVIRAIPMGIAAALIAVVALAIAPKGLIEQRVVQPMERPYLAGAALIILVIVLGTVALRPIPTDVAVGDLTADILGRKDEWLFDLLLATTLLAGTLMPSIRRQLQNQRGTPLCRLIWYMNGALTAIMVLVLPLLFGAYIHRAEYPLISVLMAPGKSVECALAVYQTERTLVVWQAKDGYGRMRTLPFNEIKDLTIGPLADVRAVAAAASKDPSAYPLCGKLRVPR